MVVVGYVAKKWLETGPIRRFATMSHDVSYCCSMQSTTISHGKRKGQDNVKHGNPYLMLLR
jgi:hypothetical protein